MVDYTKINISLMIQLMMSSEEEQTILWAVNRRRTDNSVSSK